MYKNIPLRKIKIDDVSLGLRQIGNGDDMVFIHGFPTHGYTWRKLIPKLSHQFRCHILDLPGLGDSDWTAKTNFKSASQAGYVVKLLKKLGIKKYSLIAHNSGATVARVIAINENEKVENLILLNTEIPHHRPPWIPFYQKMGLLPTVPSIIRRLLRQDWFIQSPMAFKELYSDKSMLEDQNHIAPYLNPIINSKQKTIGAFKYLKGIDWQLVDQFEHTHKAIRADVLFLWGEDDKTFPINLGKKMTKQFQCKYEFIPIKNASLLPHEEKPDEVANAILKFVETKYRIYNQK